ncbi:MAG: hypothetical protein ACYTHJ_07975 [Planctomycetota bacterium]
MGGIYAVLILGVSHGCFTWFINPFPIARSDLRTKIAVLTADARPAVLFAGDSRAECQLDPAQAANLLDMKKGAIVNIAVRGGDSAMAAAAFHNFGDRFASRPVVVLSVSPHFVANRGKLDPYYNTEYYWSAGLMERFKSLSVKNAVRVSFAPEVLFADRIVEYFVPSKVSYPWREGGFRPIAGAPDDPGTDGYAATIARMRRWDCFSVGALSSHPWQLFIRDLRAMREQGAQVVLLDAPEHPAMLESLAGTAEGDNFDHFHRTLETVAERLGITLLRYDAADIGINDADGCFDDGVHLNKAGATLLTRRLCEDLVRLRHQGNVRMANLSVMAQVE